MERVEIPDTSPFMIGPDRSVRQRHVARKYLCDLLACLRGEIRLGNQTDDSMAFVEPGEGRRNSQQIECEKCREESSYQWS